MLVHNGIGIILHNTNVEWVGGLDITGPFQGNCQPNLEQLNFDYDLLNWWSILHMLSGG